MVDDLCGAGLGLGGLSVSKPSRFSQKGWSMLFTMDFNILSGG